ncbi:MAG: hypothetical protein P4L84_23420 [Isosphaeraceae bacterium]|nr:hypothetical protein [Isosphaeraceae bacterium]
MSSEIIEPPLGTPHPDASPDVTGPDCPPSQAPSAPPSPDYLPRSGSTDELSLALEAKPDPLLGEFDPTASERPPVAEAAIESEAPRSSAELAALDIEPPLPLQPVQPPGSFEAFGPLVEPAPHVSAEAVSEAPRSEAPSGSFDDLAAVAMTEEPPAPLAEPVTLPVDHEPPSEAFPGIDLSASPPVAPAAGKREPDDDDEDDDYDDEPRGVSLGFVLLLSYASAVTIGLLYVLITGRTLKHTEEPDFLPPVDERVDPGQRAKFSRKLAPPPAIKADHLTALGKAVRVGGLEVTPVEVTTGRIVLTHLIGGGETRNEGSDAIKLRLRLKNISKDLVYAPLDEAFLREREAGVTDSFIELPDGQNIELHPLAVTSEWAIVGQEFKELKPGETLDTLVVSAKDALKRAAPEMTWRVRLRTGVDQTDYVGVRFKASEIKPGS